MCKCNDSAAFSHHSLSMCTFFLYTSVKCACGTLQINRQIKSNCLPKRMATVQVIHISLLCCHVLDPNNCAAVLYHFRSTLKRQLYTDKYSMCGTLQIKSPFTYTFITHWMAGVHVIWFLVLHLCNCSDSAAFFHHFLPICTRFLYTSVECACGTLQTNRQIKSSCLTKCMATVQVIHISLLCYHVLHPNNCSAVLDHFRFTLKRQLYTDKDSMCGIL